jgi:hypothetical protein
MTIDYFAYLIIAISCIFINNIVIERYILGIFTLIVTVRYIHFFFSVGLQLAKYKPKIDEEKSKLLH